MTTKKNTKATKAAKGVAPVVAATEAAKPDTLSPATQADASGALQEPEIAERVDTSHPAIDDEPRKGLPADSNRIDLNDPSIPGDVAVERALAEQGLGTTAKAD